MSDAGRDLWGAVVPHAPVLITGASGRDAGVTAACTEIGASIVEWGAEAVVVISPHGSDPGVYEPPEGSLAAMGLPLVTAQRGSAPDLAACIASDWGRDLGFADDHGIVVPMVMGAVPELPVVACALPEPSGPARSGVAGVLRDASALAATVGAAVRGRRVAVVASAHSSAALSPRGPLGRTEQGMELHSKISAALAGDAGDLARIFPEEWAEGGACGTGALHAFGLLFDGARMSTLAAAQPYGVGYVVAATTTGA